MGRDEFLNREGVSDVLLLETPTNNRVILGDSSIRHKVGLHQDGDDAVTKGTIDAWTVAAPREPGYEDPCVPRVRTLQ